MTGIRRWDDKEPFGLSRSDTSFLLNQLEWRCEEWESGLLVITEGGCGAACMPVVVLRCKVSLSLSLSRSLSLYQSVFGAWARTAIVIGARMMMMRAWPHRFPHSCWRAGETHGERSEQHKHAEGDSEREARNSGEHSQLSGEPLGTREHRRRRASVDCFPASPPPRMFCAPGSFLRYTKQSPRRPHGHWSPDAHPLRRHGRVLVTAGSAGVFGVPGAPGHHG